MGATVSTGKKVAGFARADGEIIYIVYEETYETNVRPHTADWSARAIGTYDDVMRRLIQSAAGCEGSGLQVRGGHTTPEAYLQRWKEAFKAPVQMEDMSIKLELGGTSMYSTICDSQIDEALDALVRIGRNDLVDALKAGPVTLQLHEHVDVIIALYGVNTSLSLWKILRYGPPNGFAADWLVPQPRKAPVMAPSTVAYLVDEQNVVVSIGGEDLTHMGWRYNAVGRYMVDVVLPLELRCDGVAKSMIKAFRDKLNSAAKLPASATITVTPENAEPSYYRDNARKLAVALGVASSREAVPGSFKVTFGDVLAAEEVYLLTTLQGTQVAWDIPADDHDVPHGAALLTSVTAFEQQALF